jgi:hypothetical protein
MPQERFSRGGGYSGIPPFSSTPILEGIFCAGDVIDNFQTTEDAVDADVPVDAQNAPTRDFENCKERAVFNKRPQRSSILGRRQKNEERKPKPHNPTVHQIGSGPFSRQQNS